VTKEVEDLKGWGMRLWGRSAEYGRWDAGDLVAVLLEGGVEDWEKIKKEVEDEPYGAKE
jgi:hypothetical protein